MNSFFTRSDLGLNFRIVWFDTMCLLCRFGLQAFHVWPTNRKEYLWYSTRAVDAFRPNLGLTRMANWLECIQSAYSVFLVTDKHFARDRKCKKNHVHISDKKHKNNNFTPKKIWANLKSRDSVTLSIVYRMSHFLKAIVKLSFHGGPRVYGIKYLFWFLRNTRCLIDAKHFTGWFFSKKLHISFPKLQVTAF